MLSSERGSSGSHYVESSLWKRLWICRKTDCRMNEFRSTCFGHHCAHHQELLSCTCSLWSLSIIRYTCCSQICHYVHFIVTRNYLCGTYKPFFSPLKPELNPICYLLALLGAHHFLHISRTGVKLLTFRLLMSYIYIYIYMEHPFLMFLDHTQRRSTVGRTPLDE